MAYVSPLSVVSWHALGVKPLEGFSDRAWLAWHSLPRDARGKPPSMSSVEQSVKPPLSNGTLQKIFNETKKGPGRPETQELLALALRADFDWLIRNKPGSTAPLPTGPVPSRYAEYGIPDALADMADKALAAGGAGSIVTPSNPLEAAVQTLIEDLSRETIAEVMASAKGHEHEKPAHHWGRVLRENEHARRSRAREVTAAAPKKRVRERTKAPASKRAPTHAPRRVG